MLAYKADEVPVGEDQRQHVELMREIARRFNARFGDVLVEPEHRIPEVGARIMDLQDPTPKMSTTGGSEQGTVLVLDEPDVTKKIKSAVTDSGSEVGAGEGKEGIANLIDILSVVRGATTDEIESEFEGSGYGDFKGAVAEEVVEFLRRSASATRRCGPTRRRSRRTLAAGAEGARDRAGTLAEVRRRSASAPPERPPAAPAILAMGWGGFGDLVTASTAPPPTGSCMATPPPHAATPPHTTTARRRRPPRPGRRSECRDGPSATGAAGCRAGDDGARPISASRTHPPFQAPARRGMDGPATPSARCARRSREASGRWRARGTTRPDVIDAAASTGLRRRRARPATDRGAPLRGSAGASEGRVLVRGDV